MKKLSFIILVFSSFCSLAQKNQKIDSIYYLIDTAKIPSNAQMWDVHTEYPAFKVYTIKCPCLQYDKEPIFIYDTNKVKGQVITKKDMKTINLINLSNLILKAKQFTNTSFKGKYAIYIVEPNGKRYIYHAVRLLKPRASTVDYENITFPDSTKFKKP
ncbi:MAG: hypothetical protein JWQ84_1582 [Mucilaginibacter sp.]|nr:hypothetical protein [Mucilaginibacter sp.]